MKEYTFFFPHEGGALSKKEREVLWQDPKMIRKLYFAKPAILNMDEEGEIGHQEFPSLKTRYLVAELEVRNQVVVLEVHQLVNIPAKVEEKSYFIDIYFEPLFGGIAPKEFIFTPVKEKDQMPNSCVLFSVNNKKNLTL